MRPRRLLVRTPLFAAMILQVAVILLAFALAPLLGVTPWAHLDWSAAALLTAVAATAPLVAGFAICSRIQPSWFRELAELVRPTIEALFHRRGHGAIAAVSLLAGLGEELLFRGVLQAWLVGLIGPAPAVVVAAVAFGLMHWLSWTYFLIATAMGLYLGMLYELTGNLLIVCLVHALYDWVAIGYLVRRGR